MTEKWASDCAGYEQGGAAEYLKAALQYERRYENNSLDDIADKVTEAGFRIHRETVRRRLAALMVARETRARANSKAFLEAFAAAYVEQNARRGGGQTPLDAETARRVYLEGIVGEWDRLFPEPFLSDEERPLVRAVVEKGQALLAGQEWKAG